MYIYDKQLAEIIKNNIPVEINSKQYLIEANKSGSCDGCAFGDLTKCPSRAVHFCCSNGGNILKEVKHTKK